jgi:hypothetical protein
LSSSNLCSVDLNINPKKRLPGIYGGRARRPRALLWPGGQALLAPLVDDLADDDENGDGEADEWIHGAPPL